MAAFPGAMQSFHQYDDGDVSYEESQQPYHTFPCRTTNTYDSSMALVDPVLHQIHDSYPQSQKFFAHSQDHITYRVPDPVADPSLFPGFQQQQDAYGWTSHTSWNLGYDECRNLRYSSPNGQFGGTLSESSSDYTMSPDNVRSSVAFGNSPASHTFDLAPSPMSPQAGQHGVWPTTHQTYVRSWSTYHFAPTTESQAITPREIEFEQSSEFQPPHEDENMMKNKLSLPMQTPEELELSDSVAALTTSSGGDTFSARSSEELESIDGEIDHDSDPDFDPRWKSAGRHPTGHTRNRSNVQTRLPRRTSSTQSHPVVDPTSRVHKPSRQHRNSYTREKSQPHIQPATVKGMAPGPGKPPKSFPCAFHAFGCLAVFANKNEWKRHVTSQHLQLGFFRCDLGNCHPDNNKHKGTGTNEYHHKRKGSNLRSDPETELIFNDFNRKDLFTQHCRRMHGPLRHAEDNTTITNQRINGRLYNSNQSSTLKSKPKITITKNDENEFENELDDIRRRCWHVRRKAPSRTSCGFCNKVFQVDSPPDVDDENGKAEERAWEDRMEHIGKHYERDHCTTEAEGVDEDLAEWGVDVGILHWIPDGEGGRRAWLIGVDAPVSTETLKVETTDLDGEVVRRSGLRARRERGPKRIDESKDRLDTDVLVSDEDASGEDE